MRLNKNPYRPSAKGESFRDRLFCVCVCVYEQQIDNAERRYEIPERCRQEGKCPFRQSPPFSAKVLVHAREKLEPSFGSILGNLPETF